MKEQETKHDHYIGDHKDEEDIAKLSDRLAPPEETDPNRGRDLPSSAPDSGIFLDTGKLKMPQGYVESEEGKRRILGLEPVIVVILLLMLVFIAFIAYLVYLTPASVK